MTNVLIVDDEKSIRLSLRELLTAGGYAVEVAADAQEALRLLAGHAFDVVVTDIILPGLSGVELLKSIRQTAPDVQVIMMTADPTVDTAAEAVRAGAFDYLSKPVVKASILQSVGNAAKVKAIDGERRRLEEADRVYRDTLERMVEERTAELRGALTKVRQAQDHLVRQERLNALGQMASGIAHDFNNVLMPIVAMSELLLETKGPAWSLEDSRVMLETIHSAADDARQIVRRLREFYRPDRESDKSEVALGDLARQAIALTETRWKSQAQSEGRTIVVRAEFPPNLRIMAFESQLRQVLINLILNAADAMPKGGTITLTGKREGGHVVLTVADTGVGMTAESKARCFELFYSTKGALGTGLGLFTCLGIVRRHGGTIALESDLGQGTRFTMTLPLGSRRAPRAAQAAVPSALRSELPLRVLSVDDDEWSREVVRYCLKAAGHDVDTAASGADALRRLESSSYDVVITDQAMQGVDGNAVARRAKELKPGIAVIMLTGFGDLMEWNDEKPEFVDLLIGKPVTPTELRDAVRKVVALGPDGAKAVGDGSAGGGVLG